MTYDSDRGVLERDVSHFSEPIRIFPKTTLAQSSKKIPFYVLLGLSVWRSIWWSVYDRRMILTWVYAVVAAYAETRLTFKAQGRQSSPLV